MAPIAGISHLLNPLATSLQLETSASQLDGVPKDLEDTIRFETARLTQAAGILLRLPQEIIAQSIILLQRFWLGPDGGSLLEHDAKDVAAACLFLTAKPSANAKTPRQILTTFAYLSSMQPGQISSTTIEDKLSSSWRLSDGEYEIARSTLYDVEAHVLRALGFQTHVVLPYTLCINYLQALDVFKTGAAGSLVAKAAFARLNSALLSPQLLYLTHQPSALATASIYLAARETDVKLPEVEWWEVFDVDREELGFLIVALLSVNSYAVEVTRNWATRKVPMSVDEVQADIERHQMLESEPSKQ
ncbi:cyclin domain [Lecanosticta acicola]|uniref:Cyclin domain n=1 Tax=Lecanosticta acicola TaxID=111012 RepID=A0AAI8YSJ6_9PEZI|nr:cyclin domain [Lecanosticta acicola]